MPDRESIDCPPNPGQCVQPLLSSHNGATCKSTCAAALSLVSMCRWVAHTERLHCQVLYHVHASVGDSSDPLLGLGCSEPPRLMWTV